MTTYTVSVTARIGTSAAIAYGVIADYHDGHPHILPPKYLRNLTVLAGGVGAGTRITFEMGAMGSWRTGTADVLEPEPGRVIHERMPDAGIDTWFIVDAAGSDACDVTITTHMPHRGGFGGGVERLVTSAIMRRVYKAELALLDQVARSRA